MKNFFKKIKSYSFWVSLSASLVLLVTALGKLFGFQVENQVVEDCVMSVAGVLSVLGIVSMNGKNKSENDETKDENNSESENDDNNKIDE